MNNKLRSAALCLTVYIAFSILLPLHRFDFSALSPMTLTILVVVPTALFMLLQLSLSFSIIQLRLTWSQYLIGALVSLALWFVILFLYRPIGSGRDAIMLFALSKQTLLGVALTLSLTCFGWLLSLIIRDKNLLLPVALIAMPIDFVGAMTTIGFTHELVSHAPNIVAAVSVSVPAIASRADHGIHPIAYIGPGDVLFMALFFATVQRFELAENRTFWWMYGLLALSMILVVTLNNFPIGALVPMGIAVIVANYQLIKLKREEVFAVLYAGGLVLLIVGLFYWSSHRFLFHSR